MCGCQTVATKAADSSSDADHVLSVSDMSCGHCERTIEDAVERAFPGASVRASAATKTLELRGPFDVDAVKRVIRAAGYTPAS